MGTADGMLARARKSIGLVGRPNYITRDYAGRHGEVYLDAPWCDMGVTYWARGSSNEGAVLPAGDRAYTVWHAQDFHRIARWYVGTAENLNDARPGDVVFFDWGGTNGIGAIDHVGIVEKALGGGRVQTIEANTGDACKRRVRSADVIAGFGRPAYDKPPPKPKPPAKAVVPPAFKRTLRQPPLMRGEDVATWQRRMRARGWRIDVDGWYGPASEAVCRGFQKDKKLKVTGDVDRATWDAAWTAKIT
jgi:hypothetical protein